MQTRAYALSTLVGIAAIFIWQGITALMWFVFALQMHTSISDGTSFGISKVLTGSLLLGCIGWLVIEAIHFASGVLYAYLHTRRESITAEAGMLGGAASAASVSLAWAIVGTLLSLVTTPILLRNMEKMMPQGMAQGGPPPGNLAFSAVTSITGACVGIAIAAAIGLIGGLLGSALFEANE
jgi:hypothetical protein